MNPQVPDELISAYFDGEVSPEERAAVEHLLASSDDAQRELNETARLSALLHSFPRESAPVELVNNVLRQTNQLPLPAQPTPSKTAVSGRNVRREWMAGLVGAAFTTVVAGLLVMALKFDQPRQGADATIAMNRAEKLEMKSVLEAPAPMAAKPAEPVAMMDDHAELRQEMAAKHVSGAAVSDGLERPYDSVNQAPASMPSSLGTRSRMKKASEPKAEMAADADSARVADAKSQAVQSLTMDGQQIGASERGLQAFSNGLRAGEFVTISDPENSVGLITAEVLDVDRSAQLLQVLLKKNSIEPRTVNKDSEASPGDFVIILIQAPADKLANVMEDVERHRDLLRKIVVEPPLQVAMANDEAKQQNERKDVNLQARSVNKEKQSDKSDAATEEEVPELQVVLEALNQRNGMVNPALGNSIANNNGQLGANRDGIESLNRQATPDTVREKGRADLTVRGGNQMSNQAQAGLNSRGGSGYDYARINNSIVTNNTGSNITNNSVTPLNQTNPVTQNPFRVEQNARRQMAYNNNQDKAGNNDPSRDFRLVFVLHPQAEGAQAPPAAAAPAKPR